MTNTNICEFTTKDSCEEKAQAKKLTFSCPWCGGRSLRRIETGIEDCVEFTHVFTDGEIVFWEAGSWLEGDIHFECSACQYEIRAKSNHPISDGLELAEWLMLNCDQPAAEAPAPVDRPSVTETPPSEPNQPAFTCLPEARHYAPCVERPERRKVGFTCPKCGHNRVRQVQTEVSIWGEVESVYDDGTIEIGDWDYDDDFAEFSYQCAKCGCPIEDENGVPIACEEDLANWLILCEYFQHRA